MCAHCSLSAHCSGSQFNGRCYFIILYVLYSLHGPVQTKCFRTKCNKNLFDDYEIYNYLRFGSVNRSAHLFFVKKCCVCFSSTVEQLVKTGKLVILISINLLYGYKSDFFRQLQHSQKEKPLKNIPEFQIFVIIFPKIATSIKSESYIRKSEHG